MRALLLPLLLLAACGEKPDDSGDDSASDDSGVDDSGGDDSGGDDSGQADACLEGAVATFIGADGATEDFTEVLLSGEYTTLDAPGRLEVCPGTWFARLLLRADIDVVGLGPDPEATILSGGESGTILDISGEGVLVNVRNLSFDRGAGLDVDHNSGGGGIYCEDFATVVGEDLRFTHNFANDGSGLYAQDCDISLTRADFTDNVSEDDGGALTLWFSTATLNQVRAEGNEGLDGGAMAWFYSDVVAQDLAIIDNSAGNFAGGVWVYDSTIELHGGEVRGNETPSSQGGGLLIHGTATLDGLTVADNLAEEGGGIFVYYFATVHASGLDFAGNSPEAVWVADFSEAGGVALDLSDDAAFECADNACWEP